MDKYTYEETRLRYAHRAKTFGIISLASAAILFSVPYFAIGFGFLSILFAFLSKGYKPHLDKDAKIGAILAGIAICVGVGTIGSVCYKLFNDADYRNNTLGIIEEFYGDEYDDILGEMFGDGYNDGGSNSGVAGGDGYVDL